MGIENAEYVKLPERLLGGTLVDVDGGSGWGIAGLDVKEVPEDDPGAEAFIRAHLRLGNLEEADAAEFDLVESEHNRLSKVGKPMLETEVGKAAPWNEPHIANVSRKGRSRILKDRFARSAGVEDDSGPYDHLTKAELVEEAERRGLSTKGRGSAIAERLVEDDKTVDKSTGKKAKEPAS